MDLIKYWLQLQSMNFGGKLLTGSQAQHHQVFQKLPRINISKMEGIPNAFADQRDANAERATSGLKGAIHE